MEYYYDYHGKYYYTDKWDQETGVTTCTIDYYGPKGIHFTSVGTSKCHPNDREYLSKFTGMTIAQYRADMDLFRQINKNYIKPQIIALNHIIGTMQHSKNYNPDSYEIKRINKELENLQEEYKDNKDFIKFLINNLKSYIEQKDKIHKAIGNGQF